MLKASRRLSACALVVGALMAVAGPAGTPIAVTSADAAVGDCTPQSNWGTLRQDLVQRVLTLVDQNRAANGLGALRLSPTLTNSAVWKSRHMAYYQYMQHDDPAPPVARTVADRLAACSYPTFAGWGENIAYGYQTPDAVMNAWMNSPGHRANILNASYKVIGIAVAAAANGTLYWTQDFGTYDDSGTATSSPPSPPPSSTTTTTSPATFAAIFTGTPAGGSAASLAVADGNTYQVASSGGVTSWYGRIDNVAKAAKSLTVTYAGSDSAACNQTLYFYNWTTARWLAVDSRSVGPTTTTITASPVGTLSDFVSGSGSSGSVAVAVRCVGPTSTSAFTARGDLMKLTYTY